MKKMKKLLALFLALILVLGMAACGSKTETPAEEAPKTDAPAASDDTAENDAPAESRPFEGQTLTVTYGTSIDEPTTVGFFDAVLPAFEEATGAKVEYNLLAFADLNTKQTADLIAGDASDILYVTGGSEYEYWSNGYICDVTGYFDEETTSDWIYYDYKAVDGAHYVVPYTGGLAYRNYMMNADLCRELGLEVPAHDELTWDVVKEYGKVAVEKGYKGLVSPFSGNENAIICNYFSYVNQAGGSLTDDSGMYDFTSAEALKAMTFIYDMFNTDKIIDTVAYDATSTIDEFVLGNALFCSQSFANWEALALNKDAVDFDWEVYNLRDISNGSFNTVDQLAINSDCENKELAAEFIKYLLSESAYSELKARLYASSAATYSSEPATCLREEFQHLVDTDKVFFPPSCPGASEIKLSLQTHQQLCALGEETPEQALAEVQKVVDTYK